MTTRKEIREREKNKNYFFELMKIKKHFFSKFDEWCKKVPDHRHQSYIKYDTDIILLLVILKNMCNLKSMRSMSSEFNKDECIENIGKILGIEDIDEIPHYDTINDFLSGLRMSELEHIRTCMIKELLKKRSLEKYRIKGKYWGVIFDGTGLFSFNEKHCDHCLKRTHKKGTDRERTYYMHHVLEAKLVVGKMVLSLGTEFIENESENVSKQDCELRAFYRLVEKIKRDYKRLPICLLGDSLYACEPVFKICDDYRWKYLIRFKDGRIKTVAEEYNSIKEIEKKQRKHNKVFWVKNIAYKDRTVNMLETTITTEDEDNEKKQYLYITDFNVTKRNAEKYAAVGRRRWKIENEGFNNQKNIRYYIQHANSLNYNAIKNHYLLTQIADIFMQLFENGLKIFRVVKHTAKKISSDLLESFRTRLLTAKDILLMAKPMQVRFA